MKIIGIICEYNPFHKGHAWQIEAARRATGADHVVCLMSGHFTQRGEPAITDKWTRAKMALEGGADVVLELPVIYAVRSAERFARGGIGILDRLGCDFVSFGSENADERGLSRCAEILEEEPPEFRSELKASLARGISYASARRTAFKSICPEYTHLLETPNNVLAVEYIRAIMHLRSSLRAVPIQRVGAPHNAAHLAAGEFPSSSALRAAMAADKRKRPEAAAGYQFEPVRGKEQLFTLVANAIRLGQHNLDEITDMEPGLAARILKGGRTASSYESLVSSVVSKRYPPGRVGRALVHLLLGIPRSASALADQGNFPYARLLGMRQDAAPVVSRLAHSEIAVASRPHDLPKSIFLDFDEKATDLFSLLEDPVRPAGRDKMTRLVRV